MQGIAAYANQEFMPPGAIADIRGAADMLERFGREGDVYVVHAAEGETVVPMEVLNSSPNLKKMLFAQMEEMGLSPERYIVGNELNSLNPVTGRPEFFFKKLWKSLKGIFKVAAPILGSIALTALLGPAGFGISAAMTAALGATATAAITSAAGAGIGSFVAQKLDGASTQDALKSSALTAGTAAVLSGFSAAFPAVGETIGSFTDSVGETLGLGAPVATGVTTGTETIADSVLGDVAADSAFGDVAAGMDFSAPNPAGQMANLGIVDFSPYVADGVALGSPLAAAGRATTANDPLRLSNDNMFSIEQTPGVGRNATAKPFELGYSVSDVAGAQELQAPAVPNFIARELQAMGQQPVPQVPVPFGSPAPRVPNLISAGGDTTGLLGGHPNDALLEPKKIEEDERKRLAGYRTVHDYSEDFRKNAKNYIGSRGESPPRTLTAEHGGAIPGQGRGDIVPAMLEPGEFVMTRNAVTGAGGGSQKDGIKRMYSMMRELEGRV